MLTKFSKVYLSIFLIALGVVAYFGYSVFSKRYADDEKTAAPEITSEKNYTSEEEEENEGDWDEQEDSTDSEIDEEDDDEEEVIDEFLEILPEDCEKGCTTYQEDTDVKYCKQVCGLVDRKDSAVKKDCEGLSGLEKDYCFKDLAIKKNDFSLCSKIVDKNVAKTCNNRLWEDVLENSPPIPM